jgi:hypothetical protein
MAFPDNHGSHVIRYNDYDAERSTVSLRSTLLTAANFDAQIAAALALRDAIAAVTLGLRVGFDVGNRYETVDPGTQASDEDAQRETKWLVRFSDVNGIYRVEIPCPNRAILDPNNRSYMLLGSGVGATFKSAFEAYVKGEGDTAVTVLDAKHVGRNI